jgi:hypothetical protein
LLEVIHGQLDSWTVGQLDSWTVAFFVQLSNCPIVQLIIVL